MFLGLTQTGEYICFKSGRASSVDINQGNAGNHAQIQRRNGSAFNHAALIVLNRLLSMGRNDRFIKSNF
jgi:hypothetical protein